MAQENIDRACDRCRERRVKCDKRQPTCARCEKLGKPCPGYDKKRKFIDEGITIRRKFQAHSCDVTGHNEVATSNHYGSVMQRRITNHSDTPNASQHPQNEVSSKLYPNINALLNEPSDIDAQQHKSHHALTLSSANVITAPGLVANADDMLDLSDVDPAWFDLSPEEFYSNHNNSCGFIPDIPNIVDEVDKTNLGSTQNNAALDNPAGLLTTESNLWENQLSTSALITDEREHEMAYLIRHFTESIGPWMDLFDRDKHFAQLAPLKALKDALLRNAIAAIAAKQLGLTQGSKPFIGTQSQRPANMEVLEDENAVDWFYKAANYYDKAIAFSRNYLHLLSGTLGAMERDSAHMAISKARPDDLLVAVSIFSLYESLDNGEIGWQQHLVGLKCLFTAVSADIAEQSPVSSPMTVGCKASFWNFARADYQSAYINRRYTYLDTEDLLLWHSCGLQVQGESLYQNPSTIMNESLGGHEAAELVSYTILWIVLRLMNYLASERDETHESRQAQWEQINQHLDIWKDNLPGVFQPCAQIRHPFPAHAGKPTSTQLNEVFFSIDVCAAAMQLYHFARILLLLNKPRTHADIIIDSQTGQDCEIYEEAIVHAHRIISIALGRPHPAVRIEMLLPLSVAGGCLSDSDERQIVLELLAAIEKDTGYSTKLQVHEMTTAWQ